MLEPLHILLVEDEPNDAELIVQELGRAGLAFTWERVETEAAYVEALRGKVDLVLSDYNLPFFNGPRAIELLQQSGVDVPLILISGTIGEDTAVAAMRLGASDYLLKDRLARLGPAINQALASSHLRRERRHATAVLRESEAKFRQVVENIREVFWMTDARRKNTLYISPGYATIWGRTCESLYADPAAWSESIHPLDRDRVQAAAAKQQDGSYDETYRIVRPDGAVRWVRSRAFPVRDAAGAVHRIVETAEDVTEYRLLEEQFRQAQKMDAMGLLAGGIAHDFNNILGAIGGYTELAKVEAAGNPLIVEPLDAVMHGARRAADLVRQILAFSRRQAQQRQPVHLRDVVQEAVTLLRATMPATIEFDISLRSDTPIVLADATQVHQVIMNLGTNAAHAIGDRPGRLTVKLEDFRLAEGATYPGSGLRPGRYALLSVADSGHGMDEATLSRIFEPFFTTKAPGEGTGLGLAAVHGIMQSHEGGVTVASRPGQGTTFRLYFPAHAGDAIAAVAATGAMPRGRGQRILYVDDEVALAELGRRMLELLGYAADTRTQPAEALAAVRAAPQAYDLVLTDQMMPGMMGTDLAAKLRAIRPDLPIILTSGCSTVLTPERLAEVGVRKLLPKPISIETLAALIHEVLAPAQPVLTAAGEA